MRATNSVRVLGPALLVGLSSASACSTSPDDPGSTTADPARAGGGATANHAGGSAQTGGIHGGGVGNSSQGGANVDGGTAASGAQPTAGGTPNQAGGTASHVGGRAAAGTASAVGGDGADEGGAGGNDDYDTAVLADAPVGYWAIAMAPDREPDLSGHGHEGQYRGQGTVVKAKLPNGDSVVEFDGAAQYLSIPSSADFSIPTTGNLTWEAWLRPTVLQFPNDDGVSGYVDWLGKCEEYGPTCEWEARMYNSTTNQSPNRPNRLSAYAFNPSAGLGSGADWQPSAGVIAAGSWYHVVGEYTTLHQPANCKNTDDAPGSIEIWVNGVKWDHESHGQTGCMSQYDVVPEANDSAVNVATMAKESFFKGAIGKVAIYDHLLSEERIALHYTVMTGKQPQGSCGDTCSFE